MKIFFSFALTALFCVSFINSFAQQNEKPVRFAKGNWTTGSNITKKTFKKSVIAAALYEENYYVLVQFNKLPSAPVQQQMKAAGITIGTYLPQNSYLTSIKNSFDFTTATKFSINSINVIPAAYKIHPRLNNYTAPTEKDKQQYLAVDYFEQVDKAAVITALKKAGAAIVTEKFSAGHIILISYNKTIIDSISALPFISHISLQPLTDQPLNYNSRAAHGVSGLNAVAGKNLNGKGVTIGVGDNADISTHIDFSGRLINRSPASPSFHGTHTAGTAAGAGILNIKNRGMAARASIVNQYFSDIIINAPSYVSDFNMTVSNNSYHTADAGCGGEGEYNVLSRYADNQMSSYNQLQHVFASGNEGELTCTPFPAGYGTVKSGWQSAKNILTVGAISVNSYNIASFSSRGPVQDGRLKPEITADGNGVLSTTTNNNYATNYGTSMACPGATGAIALLTERYRQTHAGASPKSALLKNLVCNTAEDLGNAGPDFIYGFGMLNARRAVEALDSNFYFINTVNNGANSTHSFTVPTNTRQLKVMLYWNDAAAASNAAVALVNDLDIELTDPSASVHMPLILNPAPASVSSIAVEGADHTNNIEQVVINYPTPGTYSARINGFSIPSASQEYVVSYVILKNAVTVEYPFGGETFVPGETEAIRWSAYGVETLTFTIEYSINNGSSWTVIDNNVAATARSYNWVVPSTVSGNALIRVSRNSTSLSDQSDFNFVIMNRPVAAASAICEGAARVTWSPIASATSYDVLQLNADTMKIVGNTTDTSFVITGLDKYKTYWMGVSAKLNTASGRRSISVSVKPNTGTCSLAFFNSDIKVDSILEPNSARQFFSNALNATRPVKISIKNLGTTAITTPFNVSYEYGSGVITESVSTPIPAGGTITYTFTGMYPIVNSGYQYNFKAWASMPADNNHLNDTAYKTVKYINNDPIAVLPLIENFESMPAAEFKAREMAIGGNKYLDFSSDSSLGRARTFVNTGFSFDGTKALTMDQSPYSNGRPTADSATLNYNLQLFAFKQLRFDFYYKNHGQPDNPANKVWIRGSENNNWVQAYNLFSNQAPIGEWKKGIINISDILASAVPPQTITQTFQLRLGQEASNSANNVSPVMDIDDGYTFDNLALKEAVNDVAVLKINSPDLKGCGLGAGIPVSIRVKNYHDAALNNIQVNYRINNGAVITETITSLTANQSLDYVFTQQADFSAYIDYQLDVWVKYPTDNYASNDSILSYTFHNSPVISSYPYLQDFELSGGGFYIAGNNSTWERGTPVKSIINKAASGSKAWVTSAAGNYADNETSYLVTPCFNLSGMLFPVLSFSHIFDLEQGFDYAWVEYSINGGTWIKMGAAGQGTNWYDDAATQSWNVSDSRWRVASMDIPVTNTTIRFRFVLNSDGGVTQEGIAIDDVRVHEKTNITGTSYPLLTPATASVTGSNNWVPLWYGDGVTTPMNIVGEINSNGQNLGTVTMRPYKNIPDSVYTTTAGQYYLGKSFAISSTIAPAGPVSLRLYFGDDDMLTIINSTVCGSCIKPADAYELGVTNYNGSSGDEDGSLSNNLDGVYKLIKPDSTRITPHNGGYYAEFNSSKLGEFWFNKGNTIPPYTNTCQGSPIIYTAPGGQAVYQWQVNTGAGYTNISNGTAYSGVTSDSLRLLNIPTSFTGYKYRCNLGNGNFSNEYTLRFMNLWAGGISTDWFTAGNWGCGTIPDQYTDVIIPKGLIRYPVLTANTDIRSIRIFAGNPVIINSNVRLTIKGQ